MLWELVQTCVYLYIHYVFWKKGGFGLSKKKISLIFAFTAIIVCVALVVGVTYALFGETVVVKNHLQVGKFKAQFVRTNLTYTKLDDSGRFVTVTIDEDKDFTEATSVGIFGEAVQNLRIVPGTYFEADLELTNKGDVAFDYEITLDLIAGYDDEMTPSVSNALAEQMLITVTYADGTTEERYLSDCKDGNTFVITGGNMTIEEDQIDAFTVRVEFLDLDAEINNLAKGQSVEFDITVRAVQEGAPTEAATDASAA